MALHRSKSGRLMSALGLGCAKTPAPAAHVETSQRNCAPWSRIVLRARCSILCWRIVFSTFRNCMSFHTGWVKSGEDHQRGFAAHVRFFSNRPTEVKRFQTIHLCGVDVARGLALLFGIGTTALPS